MSAMVNKIIFRLSKTRLNLYLNRMEIVQQGSFQVDNSVLPYLAMHSKLKKYNIFTTKKAILSPNCWSKI